MDEHREFHLLHLPHLINYVVPVLLQSKSGTIQIGSGVLVSAFGRHFVATAKHCIDGQVRVVRSTNPLQPDEKGVDVGTRELQVLENGWHDTLDLGYLEVADPKCAELKWDQLSYEPTVGERVRFVGYPETLTQTIEMQSGKPTSISLCAATFGTTLAVNTAEVLTFPYPQSGSKYDLATGTWTSNPFPVTPKGFSGGACFALTNSIGVIAHVEYKLLAIQYAWNARRRVVLATPINRWCDLLMERRLKP